VGPICSTLGQDGKRDSTSSKSSKSVGETPQGDKEQPSTKQQQQGTLNVKNPNNDHRGDFWWMPTMMTNQKAPQKWVSSFGIGSVEGRYHRPSPFDLAWVLYEKEISISTNSKYYWIVVRLTPRYLISDQ